MKFYDHPTVYGRLRRFHLHDAHLMDTETWLRKVLPTNSTGIPRHHLEAECRWILDRRPYYSVYPAIADALGRVKLNLDCSLVKLPLPRLLVRFAEQHPLSVGDASLRTMLAFQAWDGESQLVGIIANFGEENNGRPILNSSWLKLIPGRTVESELTPETVGGTPALLPHLIVCMRIVVALCLLQDDPDLVIADVLAADADKYERDRDPKYVERAHRRGKIGWIVGANFEVDPHYRCDHVGIRWTGVGGSIPRLVPIKGCWVKRDRLSEIPTGYLDDDVMAAHP